MKNVIVLGSSGSIGTQTLDVCEKHANKLNVVGLAVWSNAKLAREQAAKFNVSVQNVIVCKEIDSKNEVLYDGKSARCTDSTKKIIELVQSPEVDVVVNAMSGAAGLQASVATLQAGKILALANKESLVVAGDIIMPLAERLAKKHGEVRLLPIDSEHGAIFQCLVGENKSEVERLWVTASGGPFRGKTRDELVNITSAQALKHPT